MIDISKIKKHLPDCTISELRPCTVPDTIQFHLLVTGMKNINCKHLNLKKLARLLEKNGFDKIKISLELSVVKAKHDGAELSLLGSGRVVVRKVRNEPEAQELLEKLAPLLKESIF